MIKIDKTSRYQKERNKFVRNNLRRSEALIKTLKLFYSNPFHPSLHVEKLQGSEIWSIRIDQKNRIFFMWPDLNRVILIDVGPHDKYRIY